MNDAMHDDSFKEIDQLLSCELSPMSVNGRRLHNASAHKGRHTAHRGTFKGHHGGRNALCVLSGVSVNPPAPRAPHTRHPEPLWLNPEKKNRVEFNKMCIGRAARYEGMPQDGFF